MWILFKLIFTRASSKTFRRFLWKIKFCMKISCGQIMNPAKGLPILYGQDYPIESGQKFLLAVHGQNCPIESCQKFYSPCMAKIVPFKVARKFPFLLKCYPLLPQKRIRLTHQWSNFFKEESDAGCGSGGHQATLGLKNFGGFAFC